jgi:hypothetical protein
VNFGGDGVVLDNYLPVGEDTDFAGECYVDAFETTVVLERPERVTFTFEAWAWGEDDEARARTGRVHFWIALQTNDIPAKLKL